MENKRISIRSILLSFLVCVQLHLYGQQNLHPEVVRFVQNAEQMIRVGEEEEAFNFLSIAEQIALDFEGRGSFSYFWVSTKKAGLYEQFGMAEKALEGYGASLETARLIWGIQSNEAVESQLRLADFLGRNGIDSLAIDLYEQVRTTVEQATEQKGSAYGSYLSNLGLLYQKVGDFTKASSLLEAAFIEFEKELGSGNLESAYTLKMLAELYQQKKEASRAVDYYERAKRLFEEGTVERSECLEALVQLYLDLGQYIQLVPPVLELLQEEERSSYIDKESYIQSLLNTAELMLSIGRADVADTLLNKVDAILPEPTERKTSQYANYLAMHAKAALQLGNVTQAAAFQLKVRELLVELLPEERIDYLLLETDLGAIYLKAGRYEEAITQFKKAISFAQVNGKEEEPNYLIAQQNLGLALQAVGQYAKAEQLFRASVEKASKKWGKQHPVYRSGLQHLAAFYLSIQLYTKSKDLLSEQVVLDRAQWGEEHPKLAQSLNNLATVETQLTEYENALQHLKEAYSIFQKIDGAKHPEAPVVLSNMGDIYFRLQQFDAAAAAMEQAMALQSSRETSFSPSMIEIYLELAMVRMAQKKHEEAEALLLKIQQAWETSTSFPVQKKQAVVQRLVVLYAILQQWQKVDQMLPELFALEKERSLQFSDFLSPNALGTMLSESNEDIVYKNLLYERYLSRQPLGQLPEWVYNNCLFYKGYLMEHRQRLYQLLAKDSSAYPQLVQLQQLRQAALQSYLRPSFDSKIESQQLEQQIQQAEEQIAARFGGQLGKERPADWKAIQQALGADEAAIEFIHFNRGYLVFDTNQQEVYAALIVRPGLEQPIFIPLLEEPDFHRWLVSHRSIPEYAGAVYGKRGIIQEGELQWSSKLYDFLWKPLEPFLKGVSTVYFAGSGILHQLNLNAIPIDSSQLLMDRFQLIRLDNTSRILTQKQPAEHSLQQALLIGAVNYHSRNSTQKPPIDTAWKDLPGTKEEVNLVQSILQRAGIANSLQQGWNASESYVKKVGMQGNPPQLLHLATHGYFFPNQPSTPELPFRAQRIQSAQHPFVRSGLILAEANSYWKEVSVPLNGVNDLDDGILTAYEVSQLNLEGTELVVLSACETGLGDVRGNEGVYGIQSAFKLAGASKLLVSLWKIPDEPTATLMGYFYTSYLLEKKSIREALFTAQRKMRSDGWSPYYWAAFVLIE